jgi:anthranilate phosphoribosyltransferase
MTAFKTFVARVADGLPLAREEAAVAFSRLVAGEATPAQMGAFLMALRVRGETVEEIVGAVGALRARMRRVEAPHDAMDVVGTGGDGSGSYNVSTCAAFVVAGAGVPVAKHGNRAFSSRCGAADVLGALGVRIDLEPHEVARCITRAGIGFMFAPAHHPALMHVGPTRVELGTRTIFNVLGPMINPAGVTRHLVGVYDRSWIEPMARALGALGSRRAWVVHGSDGLDEITTTGETHVAALEDGAVRVFTIAPEDVGFRPSAPETLAGGDAPENARALRAVLSGERGAYRDIVALNAAAALVVAQRASDLGSGLALAERAIESGAALDRLERLVAVSQACAREREDISR